MSGRDDYTFGDDAERDDEDPLPSAAWILESLAAMFPPLTVDDLRLSLWEERS